MSQERGIASVTQSSSCMYIYGFDLLAMQLGMGRDDQKTCMDFSSGCTRTISFFQRYTAVTLLGMIRGCGLQYMYSTFPFLAAV